MGRKWYRNLLWIRRISFDPVEFHFLWHFLWVVGVILMDVYKKRAPVCVPLNDGYSWGVKWGKDRKKNAVLLCPAQLDYPTNSKPLWETGCVGHVCRINTGLVVLVVSATTSGSLIPHFNILVLIRKPSVFPPYCHLECFPVTFSLTRDLNCFLSEQEKKCRLCFAVNSRFPCFHLAAGIQTAFAFGTERM